MSEDTQRGLQRFDGEQQLPLGFEKLSEEDQRAILRRLNDKHADLMVDVLRAREQTREAEETLRVHNESIEQLDHERKIYSSRVSANTGAGKIDMQVRGGDTRFIVPILVVIGVVLLAVIAIFALR